MVATVCATITMDRIAHPTRNSTLKFSTRLPTWNPQEATFLIAVVWGLTELLVTHTGYSRRGPLAALPAKAQVVDLSLLVAPGVFGFIDRRYRSRHSI